MWKFTLILGAATFVSCALATRIKQATDVTPQNTQRSGQSSLPEAPGDRIEDVTPRSSQFDTARSSASMGTPMTIPAEAISEVGNPMLSGVFELGSHDEARIHVKQDVPEQGIIDFIGSSSPHIPADAKKVLGESLLYGVSRANFMKSSTWDDSKLLLTVELETRTGKLFGEIATTSNMPIFLSLDEHLEFDFGGGSGIVSFTGVHTEPSKQGVGLYEELMRVKGLSLTDSTVEDRKKAAKEYLFATSGMSRAWKHFGNFNTDGKIRKILETKFNKLAMRTLINANKDWGFVFLSMCVAPPMTITEMGFENGLVYFKSELYETQDRRYRDYGFMAMSEVLAKQAILGANDLEESFAKSAVNFARAGGWGVETTREAMEAEGRNAGDPASIGNMIAFCVGSVPGKDPECSGSEPGRVSWGTQEPASMTASALFG